MIEATITVVGNVATEPVLGCTTSGTAYTHFRMAANGMRFDKRSRRWIPDDASYYTVYCWRAPLADNVKASLGVGNPIFVHGRMRVKEWKDDKDIAHWIAEIDARAIGHDLFRGLSTFDKPKTDDTSIKEEDQAIREVRNGYLKRSAEEDDQASSRRDAAEGHGSSVDLRTGEIIGPSANGTTSEPRKSDDKASPSQRSAGDGSAGKGSTGKSDVGKVRDDAVVGSAA